MNFSELMSQASQNKHRAEKQYAQKRQGQAEAEDSQRVSSAAVKAFLLKKEKEKKQQQVEQAKACKVRMQARLEQSLNSKKGRKRSTEDSIGKERTKPSDSSDTTMLTARGTEKKKISTAVARQRPNEPSDSHTSRLHKKEASKKLEHQDHRIVNSTSSAVKKGNREVTKQPGPSVVRQPATDISKQANSVTTKLKKTAKTRPPMDFKELLAMAEMNKNHPPGAVSGSVEKRTAKHDVTNNELESTLPSKAAVKNLIEHSRNRKPADRQGVDTSAKSSEKRAHTKEKLREAKRDEHVKRRMLDHKVTDSHSMNLPKASSYDRYKPAREPSQTRNASIQVRDPYWNHERGREGDRTHDDNGMDDFIDDFIDDEGTDVDVSKCIRDIFGYDRSRYNDSERDCALMESSFSQIEKEEARSSKIAKLEDEVEFLKEQAALKKQKQALMKQRKMK